MKTRKVKMVACLAGDGFVWNIGDEVDVLADEVGRLIAAGHAVDVDGADDLPTRELPKPTRQRRKKSDEASVLVPDQVDDVTVAN